MILRLGCLYYFANETAAHAKGSFTLSGYKCVHVYIGELGVSGLLYAQCYN